MDGVRPSSHLPRPPAGAARGQALVELCAEDGIAEEHLELMFQDEEPKDWPPAGSFDSDYFLDALKG